MKSSPSADSLQPERKSKFPFPSPQNRPGKRSRMGHFGLMLLILILGLCMYGGIRYKQKADTSHIRLTVIFGSEGIQFWDEVREGMREEAEKQGVILSEYTPDDENLFPSLIESALYTDTDAVAICLYDTEMWEECQPYLSRMREKGIKVIVADTPPEVEEYDVYVGLDNYAIGEEMADYVSSIAAADEKILVRGATTENLVLQSRSDGFYDRMEELGRGESLERLTANTTTLEGITELKSIIHTLDSPAVLVAFTTNGTTSIADVIKSEGVKEQVQLVSFGEYARAKDYVDQGLVNKFFAQDNTAMGSEVVLSAVRLCQGENIENRKVDVPVLEYPSDK